jgi:hypothetical protein
MRVCTRCHANDVQLLTLAEPKGPLGLPSPDPGAVLALACHVVMVHAGCQVRARVRAAVRARVWGVPVWLWARSASPWAMQLQPPAATRSHPQPPCHITVCMCVFVCCMCYVVCAEHAAEWGCALQQVRPPAAVDQGVQG